MNDPDQTITFSSIQKTDGSYPQKSDGLDDAWTEDEVTTDEENPTVDRAAAFVSLAFITAALKRSAWFLCATAIFGLIIGYALYAKFPPSYSAKTSVLLSGTTNSVPTQQLNTNVALAQSHSHDWDLAAADLLVHEAGGALTSLTGATLTYNRPDPVHDVLVAAGRERHAALVDLLRERHSQFA